MAKCFMDEAKVHEISQWLLKANHDLESAKRLLAGDPPYRDTAVFHCQQAAEKALKAHLTLCDSPFSKVHDLRVLVKQAAGFDARFQQFVEAAEVLTPYATAFRYPGDVSEPTPADAAEAVLLAGAVLDYVIGQMPAEARTNLSR